MVFEVQEKQGSRKKKSELVEMTFGKVEKVMFALLCKMFLVFFLMKKKEKEEGGGRNLSFPSRCHKLIN